MGKDFLRYLKTRNQKEKIDNVTMKSKAKTDWKNIFVVYGGQRNHSFNVSISLVKQ